MIADKYNAYKHISIHPVKPAVIIYDEQDVIKSFNETAEELTDYSKNEVVGSRMSALKSALGLDQVLLSGELYELECKKGYKKTILVDISQMNGPDGGQLSVFCFTDQSYYLELQTKQGVEISLDGATGVYNYRGITDLLNNEAKRASRYKRALSIIVVQIKNYQTMDSLYGEGKSDIVLQTLAIILKNETRDVDFIGRLAEDIFLTILPDTAYKAASVVAKRINRTAANYSDEETPFTISLATRAIESYEEIEWHEAAVAMLIQENEE